MPSKERQSVKSRSPPVASGGGLAVPRTTPALRYNGNVARQAKPARKAKKGFFGLLFSFATRVGVFYLLIAALWQCSSPPLHFRYNANDARPACRQIASLQSALLPHLAPLNAKLQEQLEPITKPLAPYVRTAYRTTKPYASEAAKRSGALWTKHGEPLRQHGFKQGKQFVDPYVKQAKAEYKKQYKKVQPHVDVAHKHLSPYYNIYNRDVHPYVVQSSALALSGSQRAFDLYKREVQPRLVQLLRLTQRFVVTHVLPALRTAYSKYVRPQADKVWAKVFERKAHAVGEAYIGAAKEEAREARKEGKERAARAVEEAASARRAQEDPSIMDRLQRAKDAVTGKVPSHEDPVIAAALDAELAAEKQSVTEELEAWETGMLRLIETEYRLVTARLAELRQQRVDDLSNRFSQLTEDFVEDDVATTLTRLERTFKKLTTDDAATLPARLDTARTFVQSQQRRLEGSLAKFEQELDGYAAQLDADERAAITASAAEVRRFTEEAIKSYDAAMERAKFAATEEAWEGWADGMGVRADMFEEEILALQAGEKSVRKGINATDLASQPDIAPRIKELRKTANALYKAALKEVDSFAKSGERELKREGIRYSVADATDALAARARDIASGAAAAVGGAALAAKHKAGEAQDGAYSAAEAARQAGRSAASNAGYSVSPEGAREHAESAYNAATTSVGAVYESIASRAKEGFNAATTSVGSVYEEAAKSAKAAVQPSSKGAFEAATTSVGSVYEDLARSASSASAAAASAAGSAYSDVANNNLASSASSLLREATRSASSLAGYQPRPETGSEYVESAGEYVKAAYNAMNDQAQVVYAAAGLVDDPQTRGVVGKAPPKEFNHVGKAVSEGAEKVASAIPGVDGAASILSDASASAASVLAQATDAIPGTQHIKDAAAGGASSASSLAAAAGSSASSLASVASASAASAASVASASAVSAASVASASGYSAAGEVGSSASSISSAASKEAASAASVASASASSAASVASASASSASSLAAKSASSASVQASKSASSVSKSLSSASSAASASGSSVVGDSPLSSVSSALSAASASAASYASDASSSVQSALSSISSLTRSEKLENGQTLSPEGFVESAKSVINEAVQTSTPGVVEKAGDAVKSAADAAKSAASSVRDRVEL